MFYAFVNYSLINLITTLPLFPEKIGAEFGEDELGINCDTDMNPVDTIGVGPRKQNPTHLPDEKCVFMICNIIYL